VLGTDAAALPAFSCYDVASAAVGAEVRGIRVYDLDPETLAPDLDSLEEAFLSGIRVAVISPLYGLPPDWEALEALAQRHGALLIEDAAQGHGASYRRRPLGSLGAMSVLSFGRGKGWTGGSGGALLLRHGPGPGAEPAGVDAPTSGLRVGVATLAQWALGRPSLYGIPMSLPGLKLGETVYHPPTPVRSMTPLSADLVARTRAAAEAEAAVRRRNARKWLSELRGYPMVRLLAPAPDAVAGYLRLPIRMPAGLGSLSTPSDARRLGVAASYPTVLAELPPVRARLVTARSSPGADVLVRELLTIPTHSLLREPERRALGRLLRATRMVAFQEMLSRAPSAPALHSAANSPS
jgi:dTDP-4-amino-4,6-dideoxygalactose transaminase